MVTQTQVNKVISVSVSLTNGIKDLEINIKYPSCIIFWLHIKKIKHEYTLQDIIIIVILFTYAKLSLHLFTINYSYIISDSFILFYAV